VGVEARTKLACPSAVERQNVNIPAVINMVLTELIIYLALF